MPSTKVRVRRAHRRLGRINSRNAVVSIKRKIDFQMLSIQTGLYHSLVGVADIDEVTQRITLFQIIVDGRNRVSSALYLFRYCYNQIGRLQRFLPVKRSKSTPKSYNIFPDGISIAVVFRRSFLLIAIEFTVAEIKGFPRLL